MSDLEDIFAEEKNDTQCRRWFLTINNPFPEDMPEVDLKKNTLPIKEDWYDLSVLKEEENRDYFVFRYVEVERKINELETERFVIKRPFFKDLDSAISFFTNLEHRKYVIFQEERGENGTRHFQCGIIFSISKRFATIKKYFPTAYIDKVRGSNVQFRDYCTKKETRVRGPFEIGEFAEQRSRTDIKDFLELCSAGADNKDIKDLYPALYLNSLNKIDKLKNEDKYSLYKKTPRNVEVIYVYGAEGVGKTTYVYNKEGYENVFSIDTYDISSFTNYSAEPVILLDEFVGQFGIQKMNKLMGKFPYQLRGLNCMKYACYTKVYILSNLALKDLYKKDQEENPIFFRAFIRRISKILRFDSFGNIHVEKDTTLGEQQTIEEVPLTDIPQEFINKEKDE